MARVRDTRAMIAGMAPRLVEGEAVFATVPDGDPLISRAIATMREAEGLSAILTVEDARGAGLSGGTTFRQITLDVHSALDGVGLTAAVAAALTAEDIPANVVAGNHHDHVFVPAPLADRAVACLAALAAEARAEAGR